MGRQFGDVMLRSIELFCLTAESGSFTAAAAQAGLTPAAVSRSIGRLEERLKVRLFVRSTRKIRLTDGGQAYLNQCKQALLQLGEAERELTGAQAEPAGTIWMSVPTTVSTTGGLTCSEDLLGVVTLVRNGVGLLQTYRFIVEEDIAQRKLVEVLQEFGGRSRPFSIIYPATRHMPLRVRAFIDYLAEHFP
jgi:DNA-binding transcriptional LysR family regulator